MRRQGRGQDGGRGKAGKRIGGRQVGGQGKGQDGGQARRAAKRLGRRAKKNEASRSRRRGRRSAERERRAGRRAKYVHTPLERKRNNQETTSTLLFVFECAMIL